MRIDSKKKAYLIVVAALLLTAIAYWPGLSGAFVFDDFPNIVDNEGVQPKDANLPSLISAALSSPSSDLSRPLASLSFAVNYLVTGLSPYAMKVTNLVIHLINGLLTFLLARVLLRSAYSAPGPDADFSKMASVSPRADIVAALTAASWMLLPINLTAVSYIVQRMESMANLFVLLGLIGYATGRRRMLVAESGAHTSRNSYNRGFVLCIVSIIVFTAVGALAKETAVMLPLYALMIEWILFGFSPGILTERSDGMQRSSSPEGTHIISIKPKRDIDWRVVLLFLLTLAVPLLIGLAWLLPNVLNPQSWITRDFTLKMRLLSEPRIVIDYILWTLLPTPHELSFYHDEFIASSGLLSPWTTTASILALVGIAAVALRLRRRYPLAALGVALFLSCHLLTGTILPLELIYEHRNYFASFGLLLVIVPLLAAPGISKTLDQTLKGTPSRLTSDTHCLHYSLPFPRLRIALLAGLLLCWTLLTALTAYAWGNPLRLAQDLAIRAPDSPRSQYELGRTYIILSNYDVHSPFTQLAYPALEKAASLPGSSILPEQALIFMNSRMHLPLKDSWWNSLTTKLKSHAPTVQDESSLASLTQCARSHECDLPKERMIEAFNAALSHPNPTARLQANYGDYAWNLLDNKSLGLHWTEAAAKASPNEPAYHITLTRMYAVLGRTDEAEEQMAELSRLNYGGRLNASIAELRGLRVLQKNND